MLDPMSRRSMWGQEKLSSSPSAPASWQSRASRCQFCSSLSLPDPAMIEAMRTRSGKACLIRPIRGSHQSSVLSEMSSQFQDECSAAPGRFFIERRAESASARRNLVFGPTTLTTGCRPMVFVTTPPHPASNARRMFASDSVGGADESRNGFLKRTSVKVVDRSIVLGPWSLVLRPRDRGFDHAEGLIGCNKDFVRVVEAERRQVDEQVMTVRQRQ